MRLATIVLLVLLGLVNAELWFGDGGVPRVRELERRLAHQRADNEAARARNERLLAEVRDLREGLEMVEESARHELGMIRPDEILVQIAAPSSTPAVGLAPPRRSRRRRRSSPAPPRRRSGRGRRRRVRRRRAPPRPGVRRGALRRRPR